MKRKIKLLTAAVAIVLALAAVGTVAFLTEETGKVTNSFSQKLLTLDVGDFDYEDYYDTDSHTGGVRVNTPDVEYTIRYSETEGGPYNLTEQPKYRDTGTYDVYYIVEAEGYVPAEGKYSVTIYPLEIVITANDKRIKFGDPPSNNGVTCKGFIGNEDESVLSGTLVYDFPTYEAGDPAGTYENEIVPSGVTARNYTVRFIPGDLIVRDGSTAMSYAYVDPDGVYSIYTMTMGDSFSNAATEWTYDDDGSWSITLKKTGSYPFYFLESQSDTFDAVMIGAGGGGASAVGKSDRGGNGGNGGDMRQTPGFSTADFTGAANRTDAVVGTGGKGGDKSGLLCTELHLKVNGIYFNESCKGQYGLIRTGGDGGDTVFGGKTAKGGKGGLSDGNAQTAQSTPGDIGSSESYTAGQTGAKAEGQTGTDGYTYLGLVSGSSGGSGRSNSWADEYSLPHYDRAFGGENAGSGGICGTRGNIDGHTGTDATGYGNGGGGGSKTAALHSNLNYGRVDGFCYKDTGSNGLTHYCGGGGNGSQGIIYLSGKLGENTYIASETGYETDASGLEFYFTSLDFYYHDSAGDDSVKHNGLDEGGYEGATYHVFVNEYNPIFYTPDLSVIYRDDDDWLLTIKHSGTFTMAGASNTGGKYDVQLVGGGQSGAGNKYRTWYESGYGYEGWYTSYQDGILGNGGHITTVTGQEIAPGTYTVEIGTGGVNNTHYAAKTTTSVPACVNGNPTTAFGFTAKGGDTTAQAATVCFDGVTRSKQGFLEGDSGQYKLTNAKDNTGDAGASCYGAKSSPYGGTPGNGGSGIVLVQPAISSMVSLNP